MRPLYNACCLALFAVVCAACAPKSTALTVPDTVLYGERQRTAVLWYRTDARTLPLLAAFSPAQQGATTAALGLVLVNGPRVAHCTVTATALACTPAASLRNTPLRTLSPTLARLTLAALHQAAAPHDSAARDALLPTGWTLTPHGARAYRATNGAQQVDIQLQE